MKAEFREKAIARHRAALMSPALTDSTRASTHARLALALADRATGERAENLDLAIEHFEKSLEYSTDNAERARTHLNLSIALRQRVSGGRKDNIERSLEHGRRALELQYAKDTPLELSDALRTLGESYAARLAGDARENAERAVDNFERALTAATYEADPQRWAGAQMGLAATQLSHPDKTRARVIKGATHCRLAQRVFTRATHPERWEACERLLAAVLDADPAVRAIQSLASRLKQRTSEDDPFGRIPDQLLEHLKDPTNLPKGATLSEAMRELLELFAAKIRDTVAERLGNKTVDVAAILAIHVVEDWDINAQVATKPPYDVFVSTNLVRFCGVMSELLTYGMGLSLHDDDGAVVGTPISPVVPVDVIADHVRILMDAFLRGEEIPLVPTESGPAHYVVALVTFFSTMTFLVSHEFGHVIFSEHRRRAQAPPFFDYAETMLEAVFDGLIAGRHHAFDPRGLKGREKMDLSEVFRNWAEEIASDIVGASLALEYQSKKGPWAAVPDILAQTKLGIHLALLSQLMINLYCNLTRGDALMSATHPPMDFRTFCVLKWLYREDVEAAEKPLADYVKSILTRIVSTLKKASP